MGRILLEYELGWALLCALGALVYGWASGWHAGLKFFLPGFLVPQPFVLYAFRGMFRSTRRSSQSPPETRP